MSEDFLVACALRSEASALRRAEVPGKIVSTGLGAARTAALLKRLLGSGKPAFLIFCGTAGQLDPAIDAGQVVLPKAWGFQDGRRFAVDSGLVPTTEDLLVCDFGLTVSSPVVRKSARSCLYRDTGASICDMESAAALEVAAEWGVPAIAPKVVSDTAESRLLDYWRDFDQNMGRLAEVLAVLLKQL